MIKGKHSPKCKELQRALCEHLKSLKTAAEMPKKCITQNGCFTVLLIY